nr:hypothetical protein [Mesorhizobium sediminum]
MVASTAGTAVIVPVVAVAGSAVPARTVHVVILAVAATARAAVPVIVIPVSATTGTAIIIPVLIIAIARTARSTIIVIAVSGAPGAAIIILVVPVPTPAPTRATVIVVIVAAAGAARSAIIVLIVAVTATAARASVVILVITVAATATGTAIIILVIQVVELVRVDRGSAERLTVATEANSFEGVVQSGDALVGLAPQLHDSVDVAAAVGQAVRLVEVGLVTVEDAGPLLVPRLHDEHSFPLGLALVLVDIVAVEIWLVVLLDLRHFFRSSPNSRSIAASSASRMASSCALPCLVDRSM